MALIKIASGTKVSLQGKTIFSTSLDGGGGGGASLTTVYDSSGNVLYTESGDIQASWKTNAGITGYVEIGTAATSIGDYAFAGNTNNFSSVSFATPSSVTNIGSSAFEYSTVTSLDLGDASASIGSRAFYACNITSLDLGNVTSIADYAFSVNLYLQSIVIPDSVTSIGDYAFGFCGFNTVDLGNGVTTIGSRAFYYNAEYSNTFTTVDIPSSVTTIEGQIFGYSRQLATVNCYTTQTAFVGSDAFYATASPLTIHVRSTDNTWTAGTGLSFQGNTNVTIIKDL